MISTSYSPARQPFLYITAALVFGLIADRFMAPPLAISLPAALAVFAVAINSIVARQSKVATLALLALVFTAGLFLGRSDRLSISNNRLKSLFDSQVISHENAVELTGKLAAPPEPSPDAFVLDVAVRRVTSDGQDLAAEGNARLTIFTRNKNDLEEFDSLNLHAGSVLVASVRLERARSYLNPGSPDYNEFLERRGYDLKGTLKTLREIKVLGSESVNPFIMTLFQLREAIMRRIDLTFGMPTSGTLKAMLIGNRYFLDRHTEEQLRASATFHVLVIAGLHVGFIASLIAAVTDGLTFIGARRRSRGKTIARSGIAAFALWAYVIMAGLAPPAVRAATMMSIGLIAPLVFRRSVSVNTVACAAFLMLVLRPALVADPGFQLSFVAVVAIAGLAIPLSRTLRAIGEWQPAPHAPRPPSCSKLVRTIAETLFWSERRFEKEMKDAPIKYRLHKARMALILDRLRVQPAVRGAALLLVTSVAIQLATFPLTAFYFNRVAPVGVLLNVFAGLLAFTIMVGGLAATLLSVISSHVAGPATWLVNAAHALLANAMVPFSDVPGATFRVAHYEGAAEVVYLIYFVPLCAIAWLIDRWRPVQQLRKIEIATAPAGQSTSSVGPHADAQRSRRGVEFRAGRALAFVLSAMAVSCIVVSSPPVLSNNGRLRIHFLDVGQGDSALVIFPHGRTLLVDAGGEIRFGEPDPDLMRSRNTAQQAGENDIAESPFDVGEAVVSRFLWSQGRTSIDYVLATHAHADHIGGMPAVERNFRVGEAIVGRVPTGLREFEVFRKASYRTTTPVAVVEAGQQFQIDNVTVQVLWPRRALTEPVTSGNDDSVVLRLVYGSTAILLAGDIEASAERELITSGYDLKADLLKVPHHGSKTSSSDEFLNAVQPRCAVISVGERSQFGHPHRVVIDRYLNRGIRLFQTGRDGTVTLETDGSTLNVSTYR
jgi:competence protein ComEC